MLKNLQCLLAMSAELIYYLNPFRQFLRRSWNSLKGLSQVVKSHVSTGTQTKSLLRTVPALYPLSYWHPIFWLTFAHMDTRWHIPPHWEICPRILTRVREMRGTYALGISYSGYWRRTPSVTGGEKSCLNRDSNPGPLAHRASALPTDLLRPYFE